MGEARRLALETLERAERERLKFADDEARAYEREQDRRHECRMIEPMDTDDAPTGAIRRECYETATEIIVLGQPESEDESHNCDAMGCSTLNHVLYRFRKSEGKT